MKKAILVVMLLFIILFTILGIRVYQIFETENLLQGSSTQILVRTQPIDTGSEINAFLSEFGNYLKKISDEYQVEITKNINVSDENIDVYATDTLLEGKITLIEGDLPKAGNSREFISNYQEDNEKSVGKFKTFSPETKIRIRNMSDVEDIGGAEGIFYIHTLDQKVANEIISRIHKDIDTLDISVLNTSRTTLMSIAVAFFAMGNNFLLFTGIFILLLLMVVLIQYGLLQNKTFGILTSLGYKKFKIYGFVVKTLGSTIFLGQILSAIFILGYLLFQKIEYNGLSMLIFVGVNMVLLGYSLIIIFGTVFLSLITEKNSEAIKGKKKLRLMNSLSLGIKMITLIFLFLSVTQLNNDWKALNDQLQSMETWGKAQNYYRLSLKYTGENDLGVQQKTGEKLASFYDQMKEKDAFIMYTNYYLFSLEHEEDKVNAFFSPQGNSVVIDENYLKVNQITMDGDPNKILGCIDNSENVFNIIIPEKFREYKSLIGENFLKEFHFKKIGAKNIYNKEFGNPLDETRIEELTLNMIWVDNDQRYFAFDSTVEVGNSHNIVDPIAQIFTGNIDKSFYTSFIGSSYYYKTESPDYFGIILPKIESAGAKANIQSVSSVYDEKGEIISKLRQSRNVLLISVIALICVSIIGTYNIIAGYFEREKKTFFVKKTLGYGQLRRIYKGLSVMVGFNFLSIVIAFLMGTHLYLTLGAGIVLTAFEVFLIFYFDKKLVNTYFNLILKGEN